MSKPRVCLNMIVKNEAHIIEETLTNMLPYISYYVINDTGSTDGTPTVITNFFNKHGINGKIVYHEFRSCSCHGPEYKKYKFFHFGWNRTYAFQACKDNPEFDYIWVIDADDIVVGNFKYPEQMTADCYHITIGSAFTYKRAQIFKNGHDWKYVGALHEYATCDSDGLVYNEIEGNYYLDSRRMGARSQDKNKYLNDALVFEETLKDDPDNARDVFYMAQSYFDYAAHTDITYMRKAIDTYQRRIDMGPHFWEEHYYSYYKVAEGLDRLGEDWKTVVEPAYLNAYANYKMRAEPIYAVAEHYMKLNNFKKACKYFDICYTIPYPHECKLFIQKSIYDYETLFNYSIAAFYDNDFIKSYLLCKRLLSQTNLPEYHRNKTQENIKFSINTLKTIEKDNIILYTGNVVTSVADSNLILLLEMYNKKFNIYVVGKYPIYTNLDNVYHTTMKTITKNKIKIRNIILYDNIDLLDKPLSTISPSFVGVPIILYFSSSHIKSWFNTLHGCYFKIYNKTRLLEILSNIKCIIVANSKCKTYGIKPNIILNETFDTEKLYTFNKTKFDVDISNKYHITNGFKLVVPNINNDVVLLGMFEDCLATINPVLKPYLSYYYGMHLFNMKRYVLAMEEFNKLKNNNYAMAEIARINHSMHDYKKSFDMAKNILDNNLVDESVRTYVEDIMDMNIEHIKDQYLSYPKDRIRNLKIGSNNNNNIILTMTTCKRFDLFEKTINSFINCCDMNDLKMIDKWIIVDDNSDTYDREKMKELYPFITFILKTEYDKGHCKSMNIIYNYVIENNVNYCIHMEDDFHFMKKMKYVSDSLAILNSNSSYGQVLFNRNYAEVEMTDRRIPGGIYKKVKNIRYLEHEHYKPDTKEYEEFIRRSGGHGTNAYWPHFSFRPSMVSCNVYKTLGCFTNTPHFELSYAKEYVENGFISTFFDQVCCIHIGKKTWETDVKNSYALNNVDQFVGGNTNKNISLSVIRQTNGDYGKWRELKNKLMDKKFDIINIDMKAEGYRELFINNTFNYDRTIMSNYIAHFNAWSKCSSEYCMVIGDNLEIIQNCDFSGLKDNLYKLTNSDKIIDGYIIKKPYADGILKGIFTMKLTQDLDCLFNIGYTSINYATVSTSITNELKAGYHEEIDGYKFYSQLDSYGNDLCCVGTNKTIQELKKDCDKRGGIAFNTNGWIKKSVCDEQNLIFLYQSSVGSQGLYVKT